MQRARTPSNMTQKVSPLLPAEEKHVTGAGLLELELQNTRSGMSTLKNPPVDYV